MARQQRRALSTIVGALLFLVILVSAFGSLITAMSFMTSFQEKSIEVADANFNQINEIFTVGAKTSNSCVLTVTIENKGVVAIDIVELFVIDSTENEVNRYDLTNGLVTSGDTVTLTDSLSTITLESKEYYEIKAVTERGTAESRSIFTPANCKTPVLVGELVAAPPEIAANEEVTVAFVVVNRGDVTLENVTLADSSDFDLTVSPASSEKSQTLLTNSTIDFLDPGETVVFRWSLVVKGGIGTTITIMTNATAADGESTGNENATLKITKEYQRDLVSQKLVAKPEVFLMHPAPFGEHGSGGGGSGIWGAIIVNPTDVPFNVSKVTFVLSSVTTESSEELVQKTACSDNGLVPNVDSEWSCPNENLIDWTDNNSPAEAPVGAREAKEFIVKVDPGTSGSGGSDIAAFLMSIAIHTSLGQFSKGNYAASMEGSSQGAIANIYLTNSTSSPTADSNILGTTTMAATGGNQTLRIALAELNTSTSAFISSGGRIVVNIPAGFGLDISSLTGSKVSNINYTTFDDDSIQVYATLSENVGDTAGSEAAILEFEVSPPDIVETRAYVMYCLTDGAISSSGLIVGTTAEIPIVVTAS
jgi:hypothetical protein